MHENSVYFSTLAQISAGLLGLVFIATSFNSRSGDGRGDLTVLNLAHQTFADLLAALSVALLVLFPVKINVAVVLVFLAALGILRIGRGLAGWPQDTKQQPFLLLRYFLSFCGYAGITVAGSLWLYDGDPHSADLWVAASPLVLLVSGSRSAWLLFVRGI